MGKRIMKMYTFAHPQKQTQNKANLFLASQRFTAEKLMVKPLSLSGVALIVGFLWVIIFVMTIKLTKYGWPQTLFFPARKN